MSQAKNEEMNHGCANISFSCPYILFLYLIKLENHRRHHCKVPVIIFYCLYHWIITLTQLFNPWKEILQ